MIVCFAGAESRNTVQVTQGIQERLFLVSRNEENGTGAVVGIPVGVLGHFHEDSPVGYIVGQFDFLQNDCTSGSTVTFLIVHLFGQFGSVEADSLFAEYRNADNDTLVDGVLEVRCIHCFAPGFRKEGSISFLFRADCCSFLHHVSVSDYFQNQSVGYTDICLRSSAERNIRCIPNLDGI